MVDNRRRVIELADAALARPAEERAAYLDATCAGDAALRREVGFRTSGAA